MLSLLLTEPVRTVFQCTKNTSFYVFDVINFKLRSLDLLHKELKSVLF